MLLASVRYSLCCWNALPDKSAFVYLGTLGNSKHIVYANNVIYGRSLEPCKVSLTSQRLETKVKHPGIQPYQYNLPTVKFPNTKDWMALPPDVPSHNTAERTNHCPHSSTGRGQLGDWASCFLDPALYFSVANLNQYPLL